MSVNKGTRANRKSRYYKTCPDCGANLDPSEVCSCKRDSNSLLRARIDHICSAIETEWQKAGIDGRAIFRSIVGKLIVGVLPQVDMNGKGETWCSGFILYLWDVKTHKTSTLCIESCPGEVERCNYSYDDFEYIPDDIFVAMEEEL